MNLLEIKSRLESIRGLPTLPLVVEKLGNALRDQDADAGRIAGIIEDDPAIMARILKIVNSSFYLGAQQVDSLRAATVRLGFRAVSNIAMSVAVFSTFPPNIKTGFDRTDFWRHCICTGIAADIIRRKLPRFAGLDLGRDTLHLCGLLHDIGKIIFVQHFHEQFASALHLSRKEQIPLCEAETRVLGIDHAQAGAWLGRKWNLSEHVIEVIRWHHRPRNAAKAHQDLVAVCHMANLAANMNEPGASGNPISSIDDLPDADRQDLDSVMELINEAAADSSLLMSYLQ